MGISNELSSDIATALLDPLKNEVAADPKQLVEIVRNFHSALQPLEAEAHRRRARAYGAPDISRELPPAPTSEA
jgi:hypothetical protein